MDKNIFHATPDDISAYITQINAWKEGKLKPTDFVKVGKPGTILKALNVSDTEIIIEQSTLGKVTSPETKKINGSKGHDIPLGIIKSIPNYLNDPLMVLKSRTQKDALVIFTNVCDRKKKSILIAIHLDKQKNRIIVNEIASVYGKDNAVSFVEENIKEGNLLYLDKKRSLKWGTRRGLQLSTLVHPSSGYINNVLCNEDIVNGKYFSV